MELEQVRKCVECFQINLQTMWSKQKIKNDVFLVEVHLEGFPDAKDVEDIAIGGSGNPEETKDYIFIGDIGSNRAQRETLVVYRIPEPEVELRQNWTGEILE